MVIKRLCEKITYHICNFLCLICEREINDEYSNVSNPKWGSLVTVANGCYMKIQLKNICDNLYAHKNIHILFVEFKNLLIFLVWFTWRCLKKTKVSIIYIALVLVKTKLKWHACCFTLIEFIIYTSVNYT